MTLSWLNSCKRATIDAAVELLGWILSLYAMGLHASFSIFLLILQVSCWTFPVLEGFLTFGNIRSVCRVVILVHKYKDHRIQLFEHNNVLAQLMIEKCWIDTAVSHLKKPLNDWLYYKWGQATFFGCAPSMLHFKAISDVLWHPLKAKIWKLESTKMGTQTSGEEEKIGDWEPTAPLCTK